MMTNAVPMFRATCCAIGYRALSDDFSRGAGPARYEFDMLMHGPIMGVSIRF
jgi:hypothetical protein